MITDEQKAAIKKMTELTNRHKEVKDKIVTHARGLGPVLRDAGREHSAKELEALYFELDIVNEEMQTFTEGNLLLVLKVLAAALA